MRVRISDEAAMNLIRTEDATPSDLRLFLKFFAIVMSALLMIGTLPFVAAYWLSVPASQASAIDLGMTKSEVLGLVGEPDQNNGSIWRFQVRGRSDLMQIRFTNGKVEEISY
jgi:hypothetical protein